MSSSDRQSSVEIVETTPPNHSSEQPPNHNPDQPPNHSLDQPPNHSLGQPNYAAAAPGQETQQQTPPAGKLHYREIEAQIQAAVKAWHDEPEGTYANVKDLQKKHNIAEAYYSRLRYRLQGRNSRSDRISYVSRLTPGQEQILGCFIRGMQDMDLDVTTKRLAVMAMRILHDSIPSGGDDEVRPLGPSWPTRFMRRHPQLFIPRRPPVVVQQAPPPPSSAAHPPPPPQSYPQAYPQAHPQAHPHPHAPPYAHPHPYPNVFYQPSLPVPPPPPPQHPLVEYQVPFTPR